MRYRFAIVALLLAAAVWATAPTPVDENPGPPPEIDLRGEFVGETSASDASIMAELADAIADTIEYDAKQDQPGLVTATAFDQLRTRAREFLCCGISLGDRHPRVRETVGDYLDSQLGNDGGPVTPTQRDVWVHCYREIARACRAAIAR